MMEKMQALASDLLLRAGAQLRADFCYLALVRTMESGTVISDCGVCCLDLLEETLE